MAGLTLSVCIPAAFAQQRNGRFHEATSAGDLPAWTTTIRIEAARLPPHMRSLVTASLPPVRTPKPQGRTTGEHSLSGIASFYWQDQKTANGERFDKLAMTAAHRTLPFGTRVRVTDTTSGRSVVVRINDRGPFKPGRVIDLSLAAAHALGMQGRGLTPVKVEVVSR